MLRTFPASADSLGGVASRRIGVALDGAGGIAGPDEAAGYRGTDARARWRDAPIETEVLATPSALAMVRVEWDDLAARADCHASDSFAWAHAGCESVAAPRGGLLRVILVRHAGVLVGVWPLVRYRTRLGAILRPLGSESSEYADILAAPGPGADAIGCAAWRAVAELGDVLILPHVRPGSLLDRVARATRRPATRDAIPAPWICFEQFPDFDAYLEGVNKDRLTTVRRLRRGLARKGALESTVLDDPASRAEAVDWVLARKQEWLAREGLRSDWVGTAGYRAFLYRMAGMSGASAPMRIFALRLDGIAWAHAHGLAFDFRIGDERYKASWANRSCDVTSFHVALTARGMVAVGLEAARLGGLRARSGYRRARTWIIRRLPQSWRRRLKTVLARRADRFARGAP